MTIQLSTYPVIFISYDEPNKESNLAKLKSLRQNIIIVDGIRGIENAYKQAYNLVKNQYPSSTHAIVINGDNLINDDFFSLSFKLTKSTNLNESILCFSAQNVINGNTNRSDSVKLFPIDKLIHRTNNFLDLNTVASKAIVNGSSLQAWRNGIREAFKLCYKDGDFVSNISLLHWRDFDKLWRYMHIGSDVENGLYAILGARMGCYLATVSKYDPNMINDFDHLNTLFKTVESYNKNKIIEESNRLGNQLKYSRIKNVFNDIDSKQYRDCIKPPINSAENFILYKYHSPYDVVFITTQVTPNMDIVKNKAPNMKLLTTNQITHSTYVEAAKMCETDYFWVITEKQKLVDGFELEYDIDFNMKEILRVWCNKITISDTEFEYNGIKLLPRTATIHLDISNPDILKSIATMEPILQLSNTLN